MKSVIVTGTPGAGKTTLAKGLAKRAKLQYIDVTKLIKDRKLSEGYDDEKQCEIVDTRRLNRALLDLQSGSKVPLAIDSHLSHYLPKKHVKLCIVAKCELRELKKRLEARGYGKAKVRENLDAEIFDICAVEAREKGHKVIEISTDQPVDYNKIIALL
jgi:adenylate kinase